MGEGGSIMQNQNKLNAAIEFTKEFTFSKNMWTYEPYGEKWLIHAVFSKSSTLIQYEPYGENAAKKQIDSASYSSNNAP